MTKPFRLWKFISRFTAAVILYALSPAVFAGSVTGVLEIAWGDSEDDPQLLYTLAPASGDSRVQLNVQFADLTAVDGLNGFNGKNVVVEFAGDLAQTFQPGEVVLPVLSIAPGAPSANVDASGAPQEVKFVSLMCKFNDVAVEPENLSYFSNMYRNQPGQLNHYWKEVSSNKLSVTGSFAKGWYTLPHPRDYYINATNMLTLLWQDCTQAADADVDFSQVLGLNLMFNELLDCCAWGGSRYATLDGITKSWPSTWNPPWAFRSVSVIVHEMGHALGLPHSNNADNDGYPYDNPWTTMSDSYDYAVWEPNLGYWGKHLNAYEKNELGFFDRNEIYTGTLEATTIRLDPINDFAASSGGFRFANVPTNGVNGINSYTVEVRSNGSGGGIYDPNLPASGVIIHSIAARSEPSWLVDSDSPPSTEGDGPGVVWLPGEEFLDLANDVQISVIRKVGNSFDVRIGFLTDEQCNGRTVTVDLSAGHVPTAGDDVILGTAGADVIYGGAGNDVICGGGGEDIIFGGGGSDTILGEAGIDMIDGGGGDDFIYGGNSADDIDGGGGDDQLFGEDGNDVIKGRAGNDLLNGGAGLDQLEGGPGSDHLFTGAGSTVGKPEFASGGNGADIIEGGADNDDLRGGAGEDTIYGFGGDDEITGGVGRDTLHGGAGDDVIRGQNSKDTLYGNAGNDTLYGGEGDDDLSGGSGSDDCFGQGGTADTESGCEVVGTVP